MRILTKTLSSILSTLFGTGAFLLMLSVVSPQGLAQEKPDEESVPAVRFDPVVQCLEGWPVHIEPSLLTGEHSEEGRKAIKMLANHLQRIQILIPEPALSQLKTVGIWIEHDHPRLAGMQYHPSREWLVGHHHDPRLTQKVHIARASQLLSREQMLKHPAVILHELAHAYHDQILGFDHPAILKAFESARDQGLYAQVLLYTGDTVRHYGLTNHKEFFAEATEAYFYRNDFFPFVRAELKEYDRLTHDLIRSIWEEK